MLNLHNLYPCTIAPKVLYVLTFVFNFNFELYSINSGAVDCTTGASIIYRSLLKDDRMSR
jgi:hypothetical protein